MFVQFQVVPERCVPELKFFNDAMSGRGTPKARGRAMQSICPIGDRSWGYPGVACRTPVVIRVASTTVVIVHCLYALQSRGRVAKGHLDQVTHRPGIFVWGHIIRGHIVMAFILGEIGGGYQC